MTVGGRVRVTGLWIWFIAYFMLIVFLNYLGTRTSVCETLTPSCPQRVVIGKVFGGQWLGRETEDFEIAPHHLHSHTSQPPNPARDGKGGESAIAREEVVQA